MKKFLSLALVCVMMLSIFALASCGNNTTDTTKKTTEATEPTTSTTTKQDNPTRYTVTEGEWDAMWSSTNFTLTSTVDEETSEILNTETAMAAYVNGQPQYFFDIIGETVYMVMQGESGNWLGAEVPEYSYLASATLATSLDESLAEVYDDLTYNEADKAYTWANGEYSAKYQFENGALVIAEFWTSESTAPTTITNVGTTQVDVPEYTIFNGDGEEEEEKSDLPLSIEDWAAVWNTNNFTLSYTEGDFEQVDEISSTKYKRTTYSDDGEIIYMYREIVNGIEYQITKGEDGAWEGVVAEPNLEEYTLSYLFGHPGVSELYNELVYDEENDEYVISTEYSTARFTIISGMLVYVEIINTESDVTMEIYSCGSTEVEIPEYTVIEE